MATMGQSNCTNNASQIEMKEELKEEINLLRLQLNQFECRRDGVDELGTKQVEELKQEVELMKQRLEFYQQAHMESLKRKRRERFIHNAEQYKRQTRDIYKCPRCSFMDIPTSSGEEEPEGGYDEIDTIMLHSDEEYDTPMSH